MKKYDVVFISVIRSKNSSMTSTHIMSLGILEGLKNCGKSVLFLAICEFENQKEDIISFFSNIVDDVIVLPSGFGHDISNMKNIILMLYHTYNISFYRDVIEELLMTNNFSTTKIISHSPSFESICYGRALKKFFPNVEYFQFWSDPMALSGITPDRINCKRIPFKIVEKNAFKHCQRIIFGNENLLYFQKQLYHAFNKKMTYIDIPYVKKNKSYEIQQTHNNRIIYAGNYYADIRNIEPLVEAVNQMPDYSLDVYGSGDCTVSYRNNVTFHDRVAPEILEGLEMEYEYRVCILNHSCIQIPGKVFYDIADNVKIVIIVDGAYGSIIQEYLAQYERFIFCNNTAEDIINCFKKNTNYRVNLSGIKDRCDAKQCAIDLFNGGK